MTESYLPKAEALPWKRENDVVLCCFRRQGFKGGSFSITIQINSLTTRAVHPWNCKVTHSRGAQAQGRDHLSGSLWQMSLYSERGWVKYPWMSLSTRNSGHPVCLRSGNVFRRYFKQGVILHVCSVAQLYLTLCSSMDCNLPGSSVRGNFQTRILEWVATFFSRASSWPRDRTCVSCGLSWGFLICLSYHVLQQLLF